MMNASSMDDAKSRASRMLEALEKSICARASAETERNIHQVIYYVFMFLSIVIVNPNTKQINMCFDFLLIPSKIFVLIVWFTEFRKIRCWRNKWRPLFKKTWFWSALSVFSTNARKNMKTEIKSWSIWSN